MMMMTIILTSTGNQIILKHLMAINHGKSMTVEMIKVIINMQLKKDINDIENMMIKKKKGINAIEKVMMTEISKIRNLMMKEKKKEINATKSMMMKELNDTKKMTTIKN